MSAASLLIGLAAPGCMWPEGWQMWPPQETEKNPGMPSDQPVSNIVTVNKIFSVVPWLMFDNPESGRIDGFKCTVYLEDAKTTKGVFGTGTIVVEMYTLDIDARGREVPFKVKEWVLPPDKAKPWRAKKVSMLGWGYGLRLKWGEDVDVVGKKIAIVIKYAREDGQMLSSSRQVLRVPITGEPAARKAARRPRYRPSVNQRRPQAKDRRPQVNRLPNGSSGRNK